MDYKIVGKTGKGICACGHKVAKGEEYVIRRIKSGLKSVCLSCARKLGIRDTIKIAANLVYKIR